jgi:hypothetical protein
VGGAAGAVAVAAATGVAGAVAAGFSSVSLCFFFLATAAGTKNSCIIVTDNPRHTFRTEAASLIIDFS